MSTLDLRVKRPIKPHSERDWPAWATEAKVIADMMKNSGLQDKAIAADIEVDGATLSKVASGTARLAERAMDALMDTCGDEAWLQFWMLKRGYDPRCLRRMENDLERENRELRDRLDKLEQEREVELRLLSRIRAVA